MTQNAGQYESSSPPSANGVGLRVFFLPPGARFSNRGLLAGRRECYCIVSNTTTSLSGGYEKHTTGWTRRAISLSDTRGVSQRRLRRPFDVTIKNHRMLVQAKKMTHQNDLTPSFSRQFAKIDAAANISAAFMCDSVLMVTGRSEH